MDDPPRFATDKRLGSGGDVSLLTVAGELDMASSPELELRLMAALGLRDTISGDQTFAQLL